MTDEWAVDIQATVQARVNSSQKVSLEDTVPLATPFSAHIDVCSVCNFKCSFCFQADTESIKAAHLKRGMMSVDLFQKIVDDMRLFKNKLKKVKIGNHGEPTLHPHLPEMITYLKQANITEIIEVFTNGSKLSPTLNTQLVNAGMQRINISLEALTDERYEEVAGVKVDVREMIENITHLYHHRGACRIYIKIADMVSVLDRDNSTIYNLSDEEKTFFFKTFGNICDEIYVEKVVPQWAQTQYEKQNDVGSTGMYGQEIKQYKSICPFIFMYLHFNCDGTVSPCTLDWPRKVIIGNVEKESVLDIWNGTRLRQLQVSMLQNQRQQINFCNECSAPMVCCNEDLDPYAAMILAKMGSMAV